MPTHEAAEAMTTDPTPSVEQPWTDDDFEEMLAGFDRIIHDKELQQQLLDAGLLVRTDAAPHPDEGTASGSEAVRCSGVACIEPGCKRHSMVGELCCGEHGGPGEYEDDPGQPLDRREWDEAWLATPPPVPAGPLDEGRRWAYAAALNVVREVHPECPSIGVIDKMLGAVPAPGLDEQEKPMTGHAAQDVLSDADIALAAALSVAVPWMLAEDAMQKAPGMIDHLRAQGFDVARLTAEQDGTGETRA